MLIAGIILIICGTASLAYGTSMNNNMDLRIDMFFSSGRTNPGQIFVLIGIIAICMGAIFLIAGIINKSKKSNKKTIESLPLAPVNTNVNTNNNYRINEQIVRCKFCSNQLSIDDIFCPVCGHKKEKEICTYCGNVVKDNASFCNKCGNSLKNNNSFSNVNSSSQGSISKICTKCGTYNSTKAEICPVCGNNLVVKAGDYII